MKKCSRKDCSHGGALQPLDNFAKDRTRPNGLRYECKECNKKHASKRHEKYPNRRVNIHLKQNYGITLEDYNRMCEEQDGKCAICGTEDPGGNSGVKRFAVDHNHDTGKVRALLCSICNTGLGKFGDKLDLVEKAAAYLRKHQ